MAHQGVSEGAFLAFLDPHVPLLLVLVVAAAFFLTRWLDNGDRSAYAAGAAAAVLAPVWLVGALVVRFVIAWRSPIPDGLEHADMVFWAIGWAYWAAGLVLLIGLAFFLVRPLVLTGLFMFAPQVQVRRRFRAVESSWHWAIGALVAAKALVLLFDLLEPFL